MLQAADLWYRGILHRWVFRILLAWSYTPGPGKTTFSGSGVAGLTLRSLKPRRWTPADSLRHLPRNVRVRARSSGFSLVALNSSRRNEKANRNKRGVRAYDVLLKFLSIPRRGFPANVELFRRKTAKGIRLRDVTS